MNNSRISIVYNNYSYFYDLVFNRTLNQGRRKAIKLMNIKPNEKIIEIGVGTGLSFKYYPQQFEIEITGIDLSEKMLTKADRQRSKHKNIDITLQQMDGENTSFENDSFDKVVIMYTYSVTPNPEKLLSEALRICHPMGSIYIINHFSHFKKNRLSLMENAVSTFSNFIGFRSDFSYKKYIVELDLDIESVSSANIFSLTKILQIEKAKNLHILTPEPVELELT